MHRSHPLSRAPWLWALALSLGAHAGLVLHRGEAMHAAPAPHAPSLQTRHLLLPPPVPAPSPLPLPLPAPPRKAVAPAPAVDMPPADPPQLPLALPAAGEWRYQLRQNGQEGRARLRWTPEGEHYELRLERELAGRALPVWTSRGRFDASGLLPLRFAHQRAGRDAQATNFRREEGLISFSASTALLPLQPGVQDRLSWWLQLPARIAAAPHRHGPGSALLLSVAGLRGELQEWRFEVLDGEGSELLHLRRAALGPFDGVLELWLDPQQAYQPVRIRLKAASDETLWEMWADSDDKGIPAQTSKFSVIP